MHYINDTNQYNCNVAYELYCNVFQNWFKISKSEKYHARRQVESVVREAGFRGKSTGLISKAAWNIILNDKKNLPNNDRVALEHPITYTNAALFCILRDTVMPFDNYFEFWSSTLITTQVTNTENQYLKTFQKDFRIGIDSWQDMYEAAGIELITKPKLWSHADKRAWGLMQ